MVRVSTWASRIRNFLLPDETQGISLSQVNQAKMAIAKGGLFGVGPGNGTMANNLTHAYSDYAYSVVIEEYGLLLGGAGLLFLYLTLMYRCVIMVTKSPKAFGALLAFGLSLLLVTQALAHMAVNVNLMPVTGLPLPLISLGGTSLLFSSISLGIILSVSRYIEVSQQ
jgi:cell division protein FtsW